MYVYASYHAKLDKKYKLQLTRVTEITEPLTGLREHFNFRSPAGNLIMRYSVNSMFNAIRR